MPARDNAAFVRAHTTLDCAAFVPEITLHLASAITPIWQATEAWLAERNMDPPFWAFAWPGGQALARHVLDNPASIAGYRVLDFAAGCGIAAIACARARVASRSPSRTEPRSRSASSRKSKRCRPRACA